MCYNDLPGGKHLERKHTVCQFIALALCAAFILSCSNETETGGEFVTAETVQGEGCSALNPSVLQRAENNSFELTGNILYDTASFNEYLAANSVFDYPRIVESYEMTPGEENDEKTAGMMVLKSVHSANRVAPGGTSLGDGEASSAVNLLKWATTSISTGVLSCFGTVVGTKLLEAFGISAATGTYLKEISGKLDAIQNQLNATQAYLAEMNRQIQDLITKYHLESEYNTILQKRADFSMDLFLNAKACWNNIHDETIAAAVKYKNTTIEAAGLSTSEENYLEKRAAYLKALENDEGFRAFLKNEKEGGGIKYTQNINNFIKDWGSKETTGAVAVQKWCLFLTQQNSVGGQAVNMFQLYDKYAEFMYCWEAEGYEWRKTMRNEDATIISLISPLAAWYFTIISSAGAESTNVQELRNYVGTATTAWEKNAVVEHDTPIYTKYGSSYAGQIFAGALASIDYVTLMQNDWCTNENDKGINDSYVKYSLGCYNTAWPNLVWNNSRLYAGLKPENTGNYGSICAAAKNLAMPSEWYTELLKAYTVTTGNETKSRSVREIFKLAGFKNTDFFEEKREPGKNVVIGGDVPYAVLSCSNGIAFIMHVNGLSSDIDYTTIDKAVFNFTDKIFDGKQLPYGTDHFTAIERFWTMMNVYDYISYWQRGIKKKKKVDRTELYKIAQKRLTTYSSGRMFFYPVKAAQPAGN